MAGPSPAIHQERVYAKEMDHRVKPGDHDLSEPIA
jgi:hypothetical protein